MIEDLVPEIAQSERLGHKLPDKIRATYSHVSTQIETRLLDALQQRWDKAIANTPDTTETTWRDDTT